MQPSTELTMFRAFSATQLLSESVTTERAPTPVVRPAHAIASIAYQTDILYINLLIFKACRTTYSVAQLGAPLRAAIRRGRQKWGNNGKKWGRDQGASAVSRLFGVANLQSVPGADNPHYTAEPIAAIINYYKINTTINYNIIIIYKTGIRIGLESILILSNCSYHTQRLS